MVYRSLIAVAMGLSLGMSCVSEARRTQVEAPVVTVALKPIQAALVAESSSVVLKAESRITSRSDAANPFQQTQFITNEKGWARTRRSIYRTTDAGKSWEQFTFRSPENSRISSFHFVDESRGWMAVWKQIYTERYGLGNSSIIYNTEDGGRTWYEQANFPAEVRINQISFLDADRGLAIGAQMIDPPRDVSPPYAAMLVLRTDNGGKTWSEVSQPIKDALARENAGPGDYGWNLAWRSPAEIFILTSEARVLHSQDSGTTWKTVVRFKDVRPNGGVSSTGYQKIIFDPQQNMRIIAGAMGPEGFWGDLVVNNNSWMSYELRGVPILDAMFLTHDAVLAVGMLLPNVDDKSASGPVGVVLQSLDCGKSWAPVYRSKREEMFISLSRVSDKEFYAVSDAGTFLRFALN